MPGRQPGEPEPQSAPHAEPSARPAERAESAVPAVPAVPAEPSARGAGPGAGPGTDSAWGPAAHRVVSVVAALSLLAVLGLTNWQSMVTRPVGALFVVTATFVALAAVGTALIVPAAALPRFDRWVLGAALVLYAGRNWEMFRPGYTNGHGADETFLGVKALDVLVHGRDPYAADFPAVAHLPGHTTLLHGGVVTRYSYPPLTLEIGAVLHQVWATLGQPWVITLVAALATVVIAFVALPAPVRVLAVPVVLGLGLLDSYVALGFPAVVTIPFLCLVAWRWTAIGAGGRLDRWAVLRAVALGLAVSAHQLAWFFAAFLLVALWTVRRGELSRAASARVLARFAGVAALVFVVLNAPFMVVHPRAWWHGLTGVLTQAASPFGIGFIVIPQKVTGHTGDYAYFSYATGLAFVGLLLLTGTAIRRLAPAVPVFVALMFLFSARSNAMYVLVLIPVWLVWAITTDRATIAGSAPIRLSATREPLLTTWPRRIAASALALVPALVLVGMAIVTAGPLGITARSAALTGGRLDRLVLRVVNHSGHRVRPRFTVGTHTKMQRWKVVGGPDAIAAGARRTLVLRPVGGSPQTVPTDVYIYAITTRPDALSSAHLHLSPADVSTRYRRCVVQLPSGVKTCR